VSAQNRQRFYVHNCGAVGQPEDRGILLKDILQSGLGGQRLQEKSRTLTAGYVACSQRDMRMDIETDGFMGKQGVIEPIRIPPYGQEDKARPLGALYSSHAGTGAGSLEKRLCSDNPNKQQVYLIAEPIRVGAMPTTDGELSSSQSARVYSVDGKSVTINACGNGRRWRKWRVLCGKVCDCCISRDTDNCRDCPLKDKNVYEVKDGQITIKSKQYPIKLPDGLYIIRKLTVTECCRLQTLPDDYCRAVSNAQAYKGLGNGWTAEVIIHILNGALKDVPKDEEIVVLSMYDGIGTGRYCLDKMGFTNVKYFAYEIDKYAMQVALSNYPDIIELGDAFQLRQADWKCPYLKELG
jgi:DNA (cytosine-5)-methyltransferase 3A